MAETLEPAEEGLYRIKEEKKLKDFYDFPITPRFVISGEISCIYKQDGKVRKVHNVILLPSLDAAERLSLFGRSADFGVIFQRFACNYIGSMSGGCFYSGAYLDSAFFSFWCIFRL